MEQILFLVFLLLFIAHGFYRTKRERVVSERDFALSNVGTSWIGVTVGISMTFVGGAATLNMSSLGYTYGWQALIDPVSVVVGLTIACVLVNRYRSNRGITFASLISYQDRSSTLFRF